MTFIQIIIVILNFAGALAIFLFGMKLMSEGLQKYAGSKLRHILTKITGKPLSGILAGTGDASAAGALVALIAGLALLAAALRRRRRAR